MGRKENMEAGWYHWEASGDQARLRDRFGGGPRAIEKLLIFLKFGEKNPKQI